MEQTSFVLYQSALVFIGISVLSYLIFKKKWSIHVLLLGGFLLALSAIHRDDYLHPWDERYHALVAKNVMDTPLEPKLYEDTLIQEFGYNEWYKGHIWLHKQPLFLWQMAVTMGIFGDDLVGMRLSSALMLLLFTFSVYRAAHLYFPKSSFWVAFLAAIQPYLLLLVSGRVGMDHNDIAFIAWVATGFWGLMAYVKKPHWKWVLMIGITAGFAMLTKWLAGSFILCIWGLHLLISKEFQLKSWLHLLMAGLIAFVLFTPWQLYSYVHYPEIFLKEWEYNSRHLTEVIEYHDEHWTFHFTIWKEHFALLSSLFLLGVLFLFKRSSHVKLNLTLVLSVLAVMIFYSWARTRLSSYTLFLLPVVLFIGASFLEKVNLRFLRILIAGALIYFGYQEFKNQYLYNTQSEQYAIHQREIKRISEDLVKQYPQNTVVFNTPPMEFVEFMFYTDMVAYEFIPKREQVEYLKKKGYRSVVLLPTGTAIDSNLIKVVDIMPVTPY